MPSRIQTTVDGIFCDESSTRTWPPISGGEVTSPISPPAEMLRTRISCSLLSLTSLPTRSIGVMRSSSRRSHGRGTAVLSEKVVDSNALSSCSQVAAGFRRMSEPNIE